MGSSPVAVTWTSGFAPVLSKECLDIQAARECGFTLKRVRDMTRTYSQIHRTNKYSQLSSIIWSVLAKCWISFKIYLPEWLYASIIENVLSYNLSDPLHLFPLWILISMNWSKTRTKDLFLFRLLLRNSRQKDGKLYVKVLPVKLSRPQSNLRKKHLDSYFAMVSVKHTRELSSPHFNSVI